MNELMTLARSAARLAEALPYILAILAILAYAWSLVKAKKLPASGTQEFAWLMVGLAAFKYVT